MNVRKPTDYSAMYAALDTLMAVTLPQMELYCEIGRLVSGRLEKGAAVAAAEYLKAAYPDTSGLSPRNLRRMRDFYRAYEGVPKVMAEAMRISWTQNVVILEAELTLQEKAWYIRAVQRFGWSNLALAERIVFSAHLEMALDLEDEVCYTGENDVTECVNNDEHPLYLPREYLPQPDGRAWHRLRWETGASAHQFRLRQIRPPDRDGPGQPPKYAPYLRRRSRWQVAPADGLYRPPRR